MKRHFAARLWRRRLGRCRGGYRDSDRPEAGGREDGLQVGAAVVEKQRDAVAASDSGCAQPSRTALRTFVERRVVEAALRIDTRRETWSIPELDLNLTASEQDTLVIAATTPATGLGKKMLTGTGSDHDQEQVLVLVHIAQVPTAVDQL